MLSKLKRCKSFSIYFVLILLVVSFTELSPFFATWANFVNIILASSTVGLLTLGAVFVIGSGGIDLSVGSILALSGAVASYAAVSNLPASIVVFAGLGAGLVVGILNGTLISFLRMPAFIVTLGMLSVTRGRALILTDGRPVYGLPDEIVFLGQGIFWRLPVPVWIFFGACVVSHIILRHSIFGIHTLCIGDNERAAINSGVKINRHKILLYALSGLFASVAGLIIMGRVNAADPSAGANYELSAITGAILGGTHLFGGKASIIGAVAGALIIGVLQNGLTLLAVPSYYQLVAVGCVLIIAVAFDRLGSGDARA